MEHKTEISSQRNSKGKYSSNTSSNMAQSTNLVQVEIEILYDTNNKQSGSTYTLDSEGNKEYIMDTYSYTATVYLDKNKIQGSFIEQELLKSGGNYLKIELKDKRNKMSAEAILNCIEYILDKSFTFNFRKDNLISYFYAFSICQLHEKRKDVLERLLQDLTDENIIDLIKVISSLSDEFLTSYAFWLVRHLINKRENLPKIRFNEYDFDNVVKITQGKFHFDETKIYYTSKDHPHGELYSNISFMKNYFHTMSQVNEKFYQVNNYFNIGKVIRRKTDAIMGDYPHYYQMSLENDPSVVLYAMRSSEHANYIISRSIEDFAKYGTNYIGEIVGNFWGTFFTVYDDGHESAIHSKVPKCISKPAQKKGVIHYETNIMGECPRYFKLEIFDGKFIHKLQNLKPEFNEAMDCYCLNFYGRVKKASAKNFQIVFPDDPDNIILQHGKVSRDEFNIDFREPFCPLYAFAVSLAAIGKKRVVS